MTKELRDRIVSEVIDYCSQSRRYLRSFVPSGHDDVITGGDLLDVIEYCGYQMQEAWEGQRLNGVDDVFGWISRRDLDAGCDLLDCVIDGFLDAGRVLGVKFRMMCERCKATDPDTAAFLMHTGDPGENWGWEAAILCPSCLDVTDKESQRDADIQREIDADVDRILGQ